MCVIAATVYGIGKTFLWPTMLAVVSEQFPKGGAITIGAAGGVGMLAAGLLGGPGIGFLQDQMRRHLRAPHRPGRPSDGGADGVSAEVSELTQAIELSPLRCTQSHRRDGRVRTSSCGSRSFDQAGAFSGDQVLQPQRG
jgi:hypothetical protein